MFPVLSSGWVNHKVRLISRYFEPKKTVIPRISNVHMFKCSNDQMSKCSNEQMLKCSNVLSRYSDPQNTLSLVHLPFFFLLFRNAMYFNLFSRAGVPSGWVNHEVSLLSRFKCSNLQMVKSSNLQMFQWVNWVHHKVRLISMFQGSNVPMFKSSNNQMFKCSNVQMFKCSNVQMLKCSKGPMVQC